MNFLIKLKSVLVTLLFGYCKGNYWLYFTDGKRSNKLLFTSGKIVFGRHSLSPIKFNSIYVSRKHFLVNSEKDAFVLIPLSKVNPTKVNNNKIEKIWYLKNRDEISIGDKSIQIKFKEQTSSNYPGLITRLMCCYRELIKPFSWFWISVLLMILTISFYNGSITFQNRKDKRITYFENKLKNFVFRESTWPTSLYVLSDQSSILKSFPIEMTSNWTSFKAEYYTPVYDRKGQLVNQDLKAEVQATYDENLNKGTIQIKNLKEDVTFQETVVLRDDLNKESISFQDSLIHIYTFQNDELLTSETIFNGKKISQEKHFTDNSRNIIQRFDASGKLIFYDEYDDLFFQRRLADSSIIISTKTEKNKENQIRQILLTSYHLQTELLILFEFDDHQKLKTIELRGEEQGIISMVYEYPNGYQNKVIQKKYINNQLKEIIVFQIQ